MRVCPVCGAKDGTCGEAVLEKPIVDLSPPELAVRRPVFEVKAQRVRRGRAGWRGDVRIVG